jgi:hypothetical protein
MKVIPVTEAQGNLSKILADVMDGEAVVLKDGANEVRLYPHGLDLQEDSPELEAELLKAAAGPFKPYSREEMRGIVEKEIKNHRRK